MSKKPDWIKENEQREISNAVWNPAARPGTEAGYASKRQAEGYGYQGHRTLRPGVRPVSKFKIYFGRVLLLSIILLAIAIYFDL